MIGDSACGKAETAEKRYRINVLFAFTKRLSNEDQRETRKTPRAMEIQRRFLELALEMFEPGAREACFDKQHDTPLNKPSTTTANPRELVRNQSQ